MKVSLHVLTPGKMKGKTIPITLSQFLIGRDPQCHLRPASPIVSNRHCAIIVRGGRVYIRDFDSMNGTFVNDQPVTKQTILHDEDVLRVGPVALGVHIETTVDAAQPAKKEPAAADEAAAALLLSVGDDVNAQSDVPAGSTIMDVLKSLEAMSENEQPAQLPPLNGPLGDTSSAANQILRKYRRPRS